MANLIKSSGISLPVDILQKIDNERGDIPRSRYILKILEKAFRERIDKWELIQNIKKYCLTCSLQNVRIALIAIGFGQILYSTIA